MAKLPVLAAATLAFQANAVAQTEMPESAHARTAFHFTVDLAYDDAFPLFGALAEQRWDPEWMPRFLYPNPAADQAGAVFRVDRGPAHSSIWVATRFDIASGQAGYVNVLNQAVVTRIEIQVTRRGQDQTDVAVVYERTAIDRGAAAQMKALAEHDATAGPEWKAAINAYAARKRAGR